MVTETFNEASLDEVCIQLETNGTHGAVSRIAIGSRFEHVIKINCAGGYHDSKLHQAFDFFRNYAPLLNYSEISKGWQCYQKALKQRSDTVKSAFWNYMDGKRIVFCNRKQGVFWWK